VNEYTPDGGSQPTKAECGHVYTTFLAGGRAPVDVRICLLCGQPDWDDLAWQAEQIRSGLACELTDMRDRLGSLGGRRAAAGLDGQAREAAARSRAFGRAAEIVREADLSWCALRGAADGVTT
jgi:hypothetical protein